jgi:hypothetical protein
MTRIFKQYNHNFKVVIQFLQLQAKLLNKQVDNRNKVSLELNLMNLFSDWHMIISLTFISDLESIINKSYEKSIA